MNFVPRIEREPTPRERAYLEALATGVRRPSISGQAGHMCRRFGWCEALYCSREGVEVVRSELPRGLDGVALVRAGYRLIGYVLTGKGERWLGG
jgi:hypothetical protein